MGGSTVPFTKDLMELLSWCSRNKLEVVVGGDFNAKHIGWGGESSCPRGELTLDSLTRHNMAIINDPAQGPTWTRKSQAQQSFIDLTTVSATAAHRLYEWKVSNNPFSDHATITFKLTVHTTATRHKVTKRTIDHEKANQLITAKLAHDPSLLQHSCSHEEINRKTNLMYEIIQSSLVESSPEIVYKVSERSLEQTWFGKELRHQKRRVKRAFVEADHDPTIEPEAKRMRREYKDDREAYSQGSFEELCRKGGAKVVNRLMKNMGKPRDPRTVPCISENGQTTTSDEEGLRILTEHLLVGVPEADKDSQQAVHDQPRGPRDIVKAHRRAAEIFSPQRMEAVIRTVALKPTESVDKLSYLTISKIWPSIMPVLRMIYSDCLILETVPDAWLAARGVLIPKPGKPKHSKSSYRIITLMPCLYKIFEKLLFWNMDLDLGLTSNLAEQQLGFRRGNSTGLAVLKAVLKIQEALDKKQYCLGCFWTSHVPSTPFPQISFSPLSRLWAYRKIF
eukprot:sb/3463994/